MPTILRGRVDPAGEKEARARLTEAGEVVHQAIIGARILVVDDNHPIRYVVRRYLQRASAVILEAENGEQAVEMARREIPDLILMDVDMPVMDGLEACRILRGDPVTARLPIVFLTGRDDDDRHMEALVAGGDDFVAKPFTAPLLLARIANMVARHRQQLENERLVQLLRRYVPAPVREERHSGVIERVEGTILFSDLRGFTATSLAETPEHVFRAISDVLARQTEAVIDCGGYVDKFSGDGMLAVFEGPSSAINACNAAASIVRWARTYAGISFWNPPPIGFGVHHGAFLRGDLGGDKLLEFTVIGGTVNIAARLCGTAKALEVIVSEAVVERIGDTFARDPVRVVNLKGLADGARIFPLQID